MLARLACVLLRYSRFTQGLMARKTLRWPSTWSKPFWVSSSTTKMTVSFQQGLWEISSTVLPRAASLSWTNRVYDHAGPAGLVSSAAPPVVFGAYRTADGRGVQNPEAVYSE